MESTPEAFGLGEVIGAALAAALPGLLIAIWAWFKARAAASPETWDDRVVRVIEEVAERAAESHPTRDEERKGETP